MLSPYPGPHDAALTRRDARIAPLLERVVGALVGAWLLSMCFSLPVLAVGPSWTLWQTLPDLLGWAALGGALLYARPIQAGQRLVWRVLQLIFALSVVSVGLLLVMGDGRLGVAIPFGVFQLFKLVQVLGMYWVVSRLPLTPDLLGRWRPLALLAFTVMVVTITWSYASPALTTFLGQFMPRGLGVAGPWEAYYRHTETGLGTIGYNHAHVAAVVSAMAALVIMLRPTRSNTVVLAAALIACFLTGARAGLAGTLLFVLLEGLRLPLRSTLALVTLGVAGLIAMPALQGDLGGLIARQATILDASDTSNLAGRSDIWQVYVDALRHDPMRLLVGSGFGSATANNGANAHTLILEIVYETGVAGLCVTALFFGVLIAGLRARRTRSAGVVLNLLAGLGLTALTTDTFYPVPAFGSFLPLLAVLFAIGLSDPAAPDRPDREPREATA